LRLSKKNFHEKVYNPLFDQYTKDFDAKLLEGIVQKLDCKVKVDKIVTQIEKCIPDYSSGILQNAFAKDLGGTYEDLALFSIFFADTTLSLFSSEMLDTGIDAIREQAVTLVKEFMMKDMIGILDNKRTRQANALSAPDMQLGLKLLIAESVDECITLVKGNAVASQTLEQALCLLKNFWVKRKTTTSPSTLLRIAQRKSLRINLLAHASHLTGEGTEYKKQLLKLVKEKTPAVLHGAKEFFRISIREIVENALKEVESRFVDRDSTKRGLPVLYKLRRRCYKHMQNRSLTLICERSRTPDRGDDKEEDETDPRKLELLLKEFCGKWQALPVGQGKGKGGNYQMEQEAYQLFNDQLQSQHLLESLKETFKLPKKLKTPLLKHRNGEAQPITLAKLKEALKNMSQGIVSQESALVLNESKFRQTLKLLKVELGYAKPDGSCLFRTFDQWICKRRDVSTSTDIVTAGHKDVRDAIVAIVLGQNQTLEEKQNFEQYFGLGSVAEWSSRMEKEFAWGDHVCLEYFARHYGIILRVHSPIVDTPFQFPHFNDRGLNEEARIAAVAKCVGCVGTKMDAVGSFCRISHVSTKPGFADPNHYVPLWPVKAVSFTPVVSPRFYEVEEPMSSTSALLGDKGMGTAGPRMQEYQDNVSKVSEALKNHWTKHWSKSQKRFFFVYYKKLENAATKGENFSVWANDIEAVILGKHKTIKLPTAGWGK